jgi:hypothetical protein
MQGGLLEGNLTWLSEKVTTIRVFNRLFLFKYKASLQFLDPNWGKGGLDYGGWFTWSNLKQGYVRV